jgi:bifunctional non-homologous end joining protein LigD
VDIEVTNAGRVLFPESGITKGDVVSYYAAIADRMVPHMRGRPLVLQRFRGPVTEGGFYQQGRSDHFPDFVGRIEVERADGKPGYHSSVEDRRGLLYLANQGALTFHAWPARVPELDRPDLLVIDLDPLGEDFQPVREAALLLRDILDERGLEGRPMLTGSTGIHVRVLGHGAESWDELRERARELGAEMVKRGEGRLTRAFYKSQRRGRLYVDTGRTRRAQTLVVPWSVRARPGAPVAAPVSWEQVADPAIHAGSFTIREAPALEPAW